MEQMIDISVWDEGSIILITPITQAATDWVEKNIEVATMFGNAIVVEHRYAMDLLITAQEDGLCIS